MRINALVFYSFCAALYTALSTATFERLIDLEFRCLRNGGAVTDTSFRQSTWIVSGRLGLLLKNIDSVPGV